MTMLALDLVDRDGTKRVALAPTVAIIAGWTGRDEGSVEAHIAELEELGVKRPAFRPIYYRVAIDRFTTSERIEVFGEKSSGEVEFALLTHEERIWVGVGSDHTDREVETYDITVSKQMCDKPIAGTMWALDEVAGHWDRLMLRSWIVENGTRTEYQQGSVAAMMDPRDLMRRYRANGKGFPAAGLMLCGTLPAIGGIRPAPRFEFELADEVLGRTLRHGYDIVSLPPYDETKD